MTSTVPSARDARSRTRRPRRKPVKAATIWLHRWLSLVIGALLVVVTTSGAILVYEPEIVHWDEGSQLRSPTPGLRAGQPAVPLPDAVGRVAAYDEDFEPSTVHYSFDTIVAESYESGRRVTLDPQAGEVIGDFDINEHHGTVSWFMALNDNIHLCMLSCEEYPGYQAWLVKEVPGSGWLGFDGAKVTWGGLLLGVTGLLLMFMAVSGVWLWWPTIKRWRHGFRLRTRKGRYARDYDLHQVIGMAAVPFLLIWGLTGAGFEFGWVANGWYAATPGEKPEESTFVSQEPDLDKGEKPPPDIGAAAAMASAQRLAGDEEITGIEFPVPVKDDPTSTYLLYYADGFDPWVYGGYAGDTGIGVDRSSGEAEVTYAGPGRPMASQLWEDWNYPVHAGIVVGQWWRIVWFVLGMVPLVLLITGLSTWLFKRKVRKLKRRAVKARMSPTQSNPDPVVDLDDDGNEIEVPVEELAELQTGLVHAESAPPGSSA